MANLSHRKGASFNYAGTLDLPAGTPTVTADMVKKDGTLVDHLTVTLGSPTSADGVYTYPISVYGSSDMTLLWPQTPLWLDVWVSFAGAPTLTYPIAKLLVDIEIGKAT